jgi:hypothetical protein
MTVWAELDGHPFDLQALAHHFPNGDPRIVQNDDGHFLVTDTLDDLLRDAGRLIQTAEDHLMRLNGWATLAAASYRLVRLRMKFHSEDQPSVQHLFAADEMRFGDSVSVVSVGTAEARVTAFGIAAVPTDGVTVEPPLALGAALLAQGDQDVNDLLAIVGKSDRLSWSQLYNVFEIIREAVGDGREGLYAKGWTTKPQLSAFTGSADHHLVSGIHESRHARASGPAPKRTMTLEEAQAFIRDLARKWLNSSR